MHYLRLNNHKQNSLEVQYLLPTYLSITNFTWRPLNKFKHYSR